MGLFNSRELELLKIENDELKTRIQHLYQKEETVKNLEKVLKKLRSEVTVLNDRKNSIINEIDTLAGQEQIKRTQMADLDQRISSLKQMRDKLQNTIHSYSNQLQDLELKISEKKLITGLPESEAKIPAGDDSYLEEAQLKITQLSEEETKLREELSLNGQEIDNIEQQKQTLLGKQQQIDQKVEKTEQKILSVEQKKTDISGEIEQKKREILKYTEKLNELVKEYVQAKAGVSALQEKEKKLISRIEKLSEEEKSRSEFARELREFDKEMDIKRKRLDEAEKNLKKITDETNFKEKELYAINQSLTIKSNRLSKLNLDLLNLEKKSEELKEEIKNYEYLKAELQQKFVEERAAVNKFSDQAAKLKEIVPLLEKRKKEIEQSNADLERRFTEMFRKFNSELSEITKKRIILEQIVVKKEKDIDERDQMLFEKITAMEESEKILNARQTEIESFERQVRILNDQKENLKNELQKIDSDSVERKNFNGDLKMETDLLLRKRASLEKSIQELLKVTSDSFFKAESRKLKLDDECRDYEDKLLSSREKINESMKELLELQASIGVIKIEHEEHRGNISKLVVMKKRLHDEILKQQAALQKFQKIREKLKIEQAMLKGSQAPGPYMGDKSPSTRANSDPGQMNAQIYKL